MLFRSTGHKPELLVTRKHPCSVDYDFRPDFPKELAHLPRVGDVAYEIIELSLATRVANFVTVLAENFSHHATDAVFRRYAENEYFHLALPGLFELDGSRSRDRVYLHIFATTTLGFQGAQGVGIDRRDNHIVSLDSQGVLV